MKINQDFPLRWSATRLQPRIKGIFYLSQHFSYTHINKKLFGNSFSIYDIKKLYRF